MFDMAKVLVDAAAARAAVAIWEALAVVVIVEWEEESAANDGGNDDAIEAAMAVAVIETAGSSSPLSTVTGDCDGEYCWRRGDDDEIIVCDGGGGDDDEDDEDAFWSSLTARVDSGGEVEVSVEGTKDESGEFSWEIGRRWGTNLFRLRSVGTVREGRIVRIF